MPFNQKHVCKMFKYLPVCDERNAETPQMLLLKQLKST